MEYKRIVPDLPTTDAVWEAFAPHLRPVYGWALRILRDPAETRRAVHQVALRAQLKKLAPQDDAAGRHQLYRLTVTVCLEQLKRRRFLDARAPQGYARAALTRGRAPSAPGQPPLDPNAALQLVGRLRDRRMAMAAYLVVCEGMTHEDAGRLLGLTESTVASLAKGFVHWAQLRLLTIKIPAVAEADARPSSCPSNLVRDDRQDGADRGIDADDRAHLEDCPLCVRYLQTRSEALNGLDLDWRPHLYPPKYERHVKTAAAVSALVAFGVAVGIIALTMGRRPGPTEPRSAGPDSKSAPPAPTATSTR